LNRVGKASTNGIATRGRRGDRSDMSSTFRRLSSNAEDAWLTPKKLVDLLKGGRRVGSAAFIFKGKGEMVRYW
jgi:hypothetical protein